MELRNLEGKRVRLVTVNGDVYTGYVGDYVYADDNEPEALESIILDAPNPIEFTKEEIKSISVLR